MVDTRFEPSTPFSEEEVAAIEREIGRDLPAEYRNFVMQYGGAFFGGSVDGSDDLPVLGLSKAGVETIRRHPDLQAKGIFPFARCELGNLYVFDTDNSVHYINYYGGRTRALRVADTFRDFIDRIVIPAEE